MQTIPFAAGRFSGSVAPAFGGRLATLRYSGEDGSRDLIVPMAGWGGDPQRWPKAGAYPLMPYSNRIAGARLNTSAGEVALRAHPDAAPHTLHGPAQLRPWQLEAATGDTITLRLMSPPDADWPWAYDARQTFRLDVAGLTLHMELTNTSDSDFPAGIGWHPYLPMGQGATIAHDARIRWLINESAFATGEQRPAQPPFERNEYLSDWTFMRLDHADGSAISITADAVFSHMICHQPPGDAYVCLEPVSHAANGFNLAEAGVRGTGTISLPPGARLGGTVRMTFNP